MNIYFKPRPGGKYPNEKILPVLKHLVMAERIALLGLMSGMSPEIIVPTHCRIQAAELWDIKYKNDLYYSLETLKSLMPLNVHSVVNIARDVFIRRHTFNPLMAIYAISRQQANLVSHLCAPDQLVNLTQELANLYSLFSDRYPDLLTVTIIDTNRRYAVYKAALDIINNYPDIAVFNVPATTLAAIIIQQIVHTQWLLQPAVIVNSSDLIPELIMAVIEECFHEDLYACANTNNYPMSDQCTASHGYAWLTVWTLRYYWNRGEVSALESFDPVCVDSYQEGATPLPENIDRLNGDLVTIEEDATITETDMIPELTNENPDF